MINSIAGFDSPHMNGQSGPAFRVVLRGMNCTPDWFHVQLM
ncbi:hypothetical protein HMPREF3213_00447 [Heyndrickxia coagulans]|uniref:Uncharacterized protein n=1 Tax=Heyndrickxia coagulans TaxID=1398 RepID=A0A133L0D4_HEYCO|nr:hypothetical protein HMPREF3213_00447 [Heyndrickxia coagulans]